MREYMKNLTPEQRERKNERNRKAKKAVYSDPKVQEKLKESRKRSYAKHKDKRRAEAKEYAANLVVRCYQHYGAQCVCCGESREKFLTIDHINNDGAEHRKSIGQGGSRLYKWLIDNNFPDTFQLLCFNCNCGRYRNGGICPHKMLERV